MAEDNGSFIRVTNREIYDAVRDLEKRQEGIERKLEALMGDEGIIGGLKDENSDLRKRVRALELKVYAVLSGVLTAIPMAGKLLGVF